jgi:membrane fusion protein (multidrug efflux system)
MGSRGPVPSAAAALACALALACGRGGGKKAAPAEQAPVTLSPENVARVEVRTLAAGPGISGTLRAKREAALRAEVGGAVLAVVAEAGERVTPGQLLCRIDDASLQQQLSAARSGLAAAKNALHVAEANARRARTLAEAGALAAQQAEQAESALEAARAQLSEAETRTSIAAEQAGKARVRAPFAGVVALRQVSVGDVVAPGAPLFTVIDPARLQFEASIPAARLGEVRAGARVDFSVTGFGDQRFEGEIERVAPAVDPATGQVRVYVDVPNDRGRLISGLYAQGRVAARAASAPAAPADAVDLASKPPTVLRISGGKVEKVPVGIGIRDDVAGAVEITSGLREGDVLVLGSARATLAEGAPVTLPPEAPNAGAQRGAAEAQRSEEPRAAQRAPDPR